MERQKLIELKDRKNELRTKIIDDINEFNKLKGERDKFNEVVRENKEKRCEMVDKIKNIISELKNLNEEKKGLNEVEDDSKTLRKIINKKEWFFQVNVLSIKKEEAIMKELKGLKAKLKEAEKKGIVFKRIRELIHELGDARQKHNEYHNLVIKNAEESDKISQKMKEFQKDIKSFKKESKNLQLILKDEIDKLRKENKTLIEKKEYMKKKEEAIMKEKEEEAITKLMNKKKLTTDDLLSFQ
ncbi:Uncharacterised protein [Candidatus Tiddalikarchaeum anstoanum]|nr:Uncharacterised protein [Candidatus Tiddalikarchaeum anstoanum]